LIWQDLKLETRGQNAPDSGFRRFPAQLSGLSPQLSFESARLTIRRPFGHKGRSLNPTMGQQLNKHIKKKRRVAYHKRRNARIKAEIAKAKKK
jgi:hypothetical protein